MTRETWVTITHEPYGQAVVTKDVLKEQLGRLTTSDARAHWRQFDRFAETADKDGNTRVPLGITGEAKDKIHESLGTSLRAYAIGRAEILAEDHARVRATGVNVPKVTVEPVLPADVVGIFVIIPAGV